MPYIRILFDVVSYRADAGHMDSAEKGAVIEVSSEEADRLVDLGAAEKATAKDAKSADDAAAKAAEPAPDEPKTPGLEPAGDGKTDQSAK